jgi:hypothetical protein
MGSRPGTLGTGACLLLSAFGSCSLFSIDCRGIAVSLDGQLPRMASVRQHAERAAGDEVVEMLAKLDVFGSSQYG